MSDQGLFPFVLDHVCYSVADLDRSIGWYRDMLGFEIESRFHVKDVPAEGVMLIRGDMRIELFKATGAAPLPPDRQHVFADLRTEGTKHMALRVDDLKAAVQALEARGVAFAKPIAQHAPGRAFCFIRDNSGNLIEVLQRG
jgi:methylmalonyl-CoA/ethylmalonyl-CoA epimerase